MLRWQPQRVHDRTRFITKLLGVSIALHGVLCVSLFFYNVTGGKITFDTKRMLGKDVIVKLVPFGQQKPAVTVGNKAAARATIKKTGVVVQPSKTKNIVTKKQAVKKTVLVHKKTAVTSQKNLKKKHISKQEPVKKAEIIAQQTAVQEPKTMAEVGAALEKTKEKKDETPAQAQQVEQPAIVPPVQEQVTALTQASVPQGQPGAQDAIGDPNVVYVNQEEFAELEMQRLLSEAIAQAWHPPVGIPAQATCQALLEVDWQGNLVSYTFTQLSGIMIYDVSVEEGIKVLTFPRAVWGKTIELIFKPWAA